MGITSFRSFGKDAEVQVSVGKLQLSWLQVHATQQKHGYSWLIFSRDNNHCWYLPHHDISVDILTQQHIHNLQSQHWQPLLYKQVGGEHDNYQASGRVW